MSVRIYQLAKQLNLENKKVIELLRKKGLDITSPSSTIPNIYAEEFIREQTLQGSSVETTPVLESIAQEPEEKTEETETQKVEVESTTQSAQPEVQKMHLPSNLSAVMVKTAEEVSEEKRKAKEQKQAVVTLPEERVAMSQVKKAPIVSFPKISMPPKPVAKAPVLPPVIQKQTSAPTVASEQKNLEKVDVGGKPQIVVKPPIVVREFAILLNVKPFRLISELMQMGVFASMNQVIEENLAQRIAEKYGVELVLKHRTQTVVKPKEEESEEEKKKEEEKLLTPRSPIVCILGHVDHGKTTLLDYIRNTNVAAKEAGGITQHIGAYQITHNGKKITFLDTPGHAAFSKMRQRGATVTDIAVLVVAADDGFMPQTEEALGFAQRENVPVIVAINKMDAKGANIDRVKQQMQKKGIAPEDWGGETLCVGISALNGTNINELLDLILLQAEMLDLKVNEKCPAEGTIIESQIEVGKGSTATVIVMKGVLKVGDSLVCGSCYCKVRAIIDAAGNNLKHAEPSTPAKIVGWDGTPEAGSSFQVVKNEKEAKRLAEENERQRKSVEQSSETSKVSNIKDLLAAIESAKQKVLKVVIKADVHGSVEALVGCLEGIKSTRVALEIIAAEVGPINQNDIQVAHAANAVVVGFNTRLENGVTSLAKHHGVRILQHNIIYELITQVKDAMSDLLEPEWVESKLGSAEIRQIFELTKGNVAGCMVIAGRIVRDSSVRIRRKQETVYEGRVQMLKRFQDDATEVKSGYECGVQISGSPAYEVGDVIECFEMIAKKPAL